MEERRLAVIMFTDMVGYSKKVHDDEDRALEILAEHNVILEQAITSNGGRVIKTIGDAFMADFGSARTAVESAVMIQTALAGINQGLEPERRMEVRIGIHAGDVVFHESDVFGDGVNIASRIEAVAGPNQIFVSGDVASIIHGKLKYPLHDRGDHNLKNIDRPVRVYEILWSEEAQQNAPRTPVVPGSATSPPPVEPEQKPRRTSRVAAAVGVVVVASVAWLALTGAESEPTERPSLAVIGFSDETGSERFAQAQIGKIIGDAVVQKFYELPGVRLVSPLQVLRARRELGVDDGSLAGDASLAVDVANEVGGQLMISGALTRLGDTYILSANLDDLGEQELIATCRLSDNDEAQIIGPVIDTLCAQFQNRIAERFGIAADHEIVPIGEITTTSLDAYAHFVRGFELYQSGIFHPGIDEIVRATEIDTGFALAYSVAACAYTFAKEDSLSNVYQQHSLRFRDQFTGFSKESLIFRGNAAWFEEDYEQCEQNYRLITELYPDDREGFHYYGLYLHYLRGRYDEAIDEYDRAIAMSPEYYPIYRDKAHAIAETQGVDDAVELLQEYIRAHPDNPGVEYARRTIAELRAG